MIERMQRSWRLLGETWGVSRQDPELAVFPILSGIVSLVVLLSFAAPILLTIPWSELGAAEGSARPNLEPGVVHYVVAFLYYLVSYFVIVFFNVGLVACVRLRFGGQNPTVRDGMSFALANS